MIVYNMRYRGPYEYDKLILNIFQFHNEVLDIVRETNEKSSDLQKLSEHIEMAGQQIESINNQVLFYKERALER